MINRDLHCETTLLMPSIDSYQKSYQRQVIQNCDTLHKVAADYYGKLGSRVEELEKRKTALKEREKKVYETIQNLFGAKSIIRIETPRLFPSEIDYQVSKVATELIKRDQSIPKNDVLLAQLRKSIEETFSLHDPKLKGDEPKISNTELNDSIKTVCQSHRVPLVYPINVLQQNSHLDKLYLPRTHHTKKRMKYIDNSLIFNTKNSLFYHFIPDKLAERRTRAKTNHGGDVNPILESGNLATFNMNLQKHDDVLESGYVPKTNAQVVLLDAPEDNIFGDNMIDMNFLNDKSTALFGGDTNFYFDELLNQKPPQPSQVLGTSTTSLGPSSTNTSSQSIQPNIGATAQQPTTSGVIPPPILNVQQAPPPAPGSIPPPPPLALLQTLAAKKAEPVRPPEDEGGNVPNENVNLKPITEEKSSFKLLQ